MFDDVVAQEVARHGGTLVRERGEGDSHFITFDDPIPAAACAADLQRRFAAEPWPGGTMRVRAALHHGEVQPRDGTYYGRVVNRCARLRSLAAGGQVLLSGATAASVRDAVPDGCLLIDQGEHRLKDLEAPEHVWELRVDGLPADFPPLAGLPVARHNLPVQTTSFHGRDDIVARVVDLLWSERLVTLTGPGGMGKSRLALHVAAEVVADVPDGAWLVELAGISEDALVDVAVATALGIRTPAGRTTRDVLLEALRDQQILVVIDNCEHLLAACADLVAALLAAAPALRVLATSREPLGIPGEHRVPLRPLGLPDDDGTVGTSPAVELLLDRALAVRPDLDRGDRGVRATAARIARAVDGLPLAIELAAARAAHLTLDDIAQRIGDQLGLLSDRRRPGRHATLRGAIGWSHDLLTPAEQVVLRRVSIFPDTFSPDGAEAVVTAVSPIAAEVRIAPTEVLDLLAQLIDRSLVVPELSGPRTRYRLLQPIRAFAMERLVEAGERLEARQALLRWLSAVVAANPGDVRLLAAEVESVRAVLEGVQDELDPAVALQLAADLLELWRQRLPTEGTVRLTDLLALHPTRDRTRARALRALGELRHEDDVEAAAALHTEAAAIAEETGDDATLWRARTSLASEARQQIGQGNAKPLLESVIDEARAAGDAEAVAAACQVLAVTVAQWGDLSRAEGLLEEARRIRLDLGHAGHAAGAAIALASHVHMMRGHYERAAEDLEWAVAEADAEGYRQQAAIAATNLGRAFTGMGALTQARTWLLEGLSRARTLGTLTGQAWTHAMLGELGRQSGDLVEAAAHYHQSIELFDRVGNASNRLYLRCNLARIAVAQGRADEAEATGLEILAAAAAAGDHDGVVEFVELVAEARTVSPDRSAVADAAGLLGAAAARRAELGIPREPVDQPAHDAALARVHASLRESQEQAAVAAGADVSWSQLVEDVLSGGARLTEDGDRMKRMSRGR